MVREPSPGKGSGPEKYRRAPFVIERASVRWVRSHECGLVFGEILAGVKRQIGRLRRKRIGLAQ